MFRRKTNRAPAKAAEYATRCDFQEIFRQDMAGLHLLAFLLTADADMAEQCFVAGLDDSVSGNAVFRQWARAWSKRAIVKNAIKAMSPVPPRARIAVDASAKQEAQEAESGWNSSTPEAGLIAAVTRLAPFDRFVLVMAVLESYPLRECATLLGCPMPAVMAAKARALTQIGLKSGDAEADRGNVPITWASLLATAQPV